MKAIYLYHASRFLHTPIILRLLTTDLSLSYLYTICCMTLPVAYHTLLILTLYPILIATERGGTTVPLMRNRLVPLSKNLSLSQCFTELKDLIFSSYCFCVSFLFLFSLDISWLLILLYLIILYLISLYLYDTVSSIDYFFVENINRQYQKLIKIAFRQLLAKCYFY